MKLLHHHQRNTRSSHRQHGSQKIKRMTDRLVVDGLSIANTKKSNSKHFTANIDEIRIGNVSGAEEARYNLATRVMSNGVEVIVASDKSTLPGGQPNLRILSTSEHQRIPLTLPPSTLKDQMVLVRPTSVSTNFF